MINYNKGDVIGEAIESVLQQTYKDIQFIIVDDGSTDSSPDIIKRYAELDPRIEYYLREENSKICMVSNFGFSKVCGEYLARIDSDDIWEPMKLVKQLDFMKNRSNCEICFTGINLIDGAGNSLNEQEADLLGLHNMDEMSREENLRFFFIHGNYLPHTTVIMKSSFQRELGGFNLAFCQLHDFDYWIRAVKKAHLYKMQDRLAKMRRFPAKSGKNMSGVTSISRVRTFNEYMMLRSHFFEDMSDEMFSNAFRCMFQNPNASTKEEYDCEKAFLLCRGFQVAGHYQPILGLFKLEKLFQSEAHTKVLKDVYKYTPTTYYEDMAQSLFLDEQFWKMEDEKKLELEKLKSEKKDIQEEQIELKDRVETLNTLVQNEKKENAYLHEAIDTIQNSRCWKASAPIRKVLDSIKKGF